MPGIAPMAVITILLSALLWGGILYALAGRDTRYLWLILVTLPLSWLVNVAIKRPLGLIVGRWAGVAPAFVPESPIWYLVFLFMLAPVFEEAIKLAPLLIPRARALFLGDVRRRLYAGMALGIGFGLGEAIYLAYGVAKSPIYASTPWYQFTGYFGERIAVTLFHGLVTGVVVGGLAGTLKRGLLSYLTGVGLHVLGNAGVIPVQLGLTGPWIAQVGLGVALLVAAGVFEHARRRAHGGARSQREEIVYFCREKEADELR